MEVVAKTLACNCSSDWPYWVFFTDICLYVVMKTSVLIFLFYCSLHWETLLSVINETQQLYFLRTCFFIGKSFKRKRASKTLKP